MSKGASIVVFVCNWDGLSCIEAAVHEGLCYPESVRIIRVTCLSRLHLGLILKAFELGADGVMLLGCNPSQCHYGIGSKCIDAEYEKAQGVMRLLGLHKEMLLLANMSRGDGEGFVAKIKGFIVQVSNLQYRKTQGKY